MPANGSGSSGGGSGGGDGCALMGRKIDYADVPVVIGDYSRGRALELWEITRADPASVV